jgi:hypothetical protein
MAYGARTVTNTTNSATECKKSLFTLSQIVLDGQSHSIGWIQNWRRTSMTLCRRTYLIFLS